MLVLYFSISEFSEFASKDTLFFREKQEIRWLYVLHSFFFRIFATMNEENIKLSENVIIADADYIDHVAFMLSVQFERIIGRKIPQADLSQWIVCIALDGGLRNKGKKHETQVVLIHEAKNKKMENFQPSDYEKELNAQAFEDKELGEFIVNAFAINDIASKDEYMLDIVKTVCNHDEVNRVMIIPNGEEGDIYDRLRDTLRNVDEDKHITMFAMQPMPGGNFKQEILGYSLMSALGIRADEIK